MKNILRIEYPNTARPQEWVTFVKSESRNLGNAVDEFKIIYKESDMVDCNGEVAMTAWIQLIRNNRIIAEIKESVCNIYGADPVEEENHV